jgi:hypothetical protein
MVMINRRFVLVLCDDARQKVRNADLNECSSHRVPACSWSVEPLSLGQLHCQFWSGASNRLTVLADLQSRALEHATTVESYLNNNNDNVFPTVDSDNEKLDGCYLTLDTVRWDLIRSGFAEQGLGRRWKEHLRASHLTDRDTEERP